MIIMNALETLKSDLISQIINSSNEVLLRALTDVFNSNSDTTGLSTAQIKMLQMGLDDINNGDVISEEELAIEDAKWMK